MKDVEVNESDVHPQDPLKQGQKVVVNEGKAKEEKGVAVLEEPGSLAGNNDGSKKELPETFSRPAPLKPWGSHKEEEEIMEFIRAFEKKVVPGFGEDGRGEELQGAEKESAEDVMKKEAFNLILSDKISLNRSVPDTRDKL